MVWLQGILFSTCCLSFANGLWHLSGDCKVHSKWPWCVEHDPPSYHPTSHGHEPQACSMTLVPNVPRMLDVRARRNDRVGVLTIDGFTAVPLIDSQQRKDLRGKVVNSTTTLRYDAVYDNDPDFYKQGWIICAFPVQEGPWLVLGNCDIDPEDPECISTSHFPRHYRNRDECLMRLREPIKRQLEVTAFNTELYEDTVKFAEATSLYTPTYISASGGDPGSLQGLRLTEWTDIIWSSDYSQTASGWRMCARPERIWGVSGDCDIDASDPHCITSPGYPSDYGNNESCSVHFLVDDTRDVELQVTDFDAESESDELILLGSDRNLTGFADLDGARIDNATTLKWSTSDQNSTTLGWRVCALDMGTTTTTVTTTITTTTTTTTTVPSVVDRVWNFTGFGCKIDADDDECIASIWVYRGLRCDFHITEGERWLDVTDFRTGNHMWIDGERFWMDRPGNSGQSIAIHTRRVTPNTNLRWSPFSGWRICARDRRTLNMTRYTSPNDWRPWVIDGPCKLAVGNPSCATDSAYPSYSYQREHCWMHILNHKPVDLECKVLETERWGSYMRVVYNASSPASKRASVVQEALLSSRTKYTPDIEWYTPGSSWDKSGFKICAWAPEPSTPEWEITGDCMVEYYVGECVASPNYPRGYWPNDNCTMRLIGGDARRLVVENWIVEDGDGFQIQDENYTRPLAFLNGTIIDNNTALIWRSGPTYADTASSYSRGWRICATELPEGQVWAVEGDCKVDPYDVECVMSRNFDSRWSYYWRGDTCALRLAHAGMRRLAVPAFSTGWQDYVRVLQPRGSKSVHGDDPGILQGMYLTTDLVLNWTAKGWGDSSDFRGWKICAREVDSWELPTTTTTTGLIYSPGGEYDVDLGAVFGAGFLFVLVAVGIVTWMKCHTSGKDKDGKDSRTLVTEADPGNEGCVDPSLTQCKACRHRFAVPEDERALKVNCPSCLAVNEFSIVQEFAGSLPKQAPLPSYWTSNRSMTSNPGLIMENEETKQALQALLDTTWKDQVVEHRTRIQKLAKFEVVMAHRNENMQKWDRYVRTKTRIAEQCVGCELHAAKTNPEVCLHPELSQFVERANLNANCNEFYLLHGTNPTGAKAICDNSFKLSRGNGTGTSYGAGIYFAEASTKADAYADEDPGGLFRGLYAMLVCRVVCGNMEHNAEEAPDKNELINKIVKDRHKHSILGDREASRGTYREFVVFDRDQVFPEFVVVYRRNPVKPEGDVQSCPTPSDQSGISGESPSGPDPQSGSESGLDRPSASSASGSSSDTPARSTGESAE